MINHQFYLLGLNHRTWLHPVPQRRTRASMLSISKRSTTKREGARTCQNWEVVLLQKKSSRSLRSRAIVGIHGSLKGPQWSVVIVRSFGDYFTKLWRKTTPMTLLSRGFWDWRKNLVQSRTIPFSQLCFAHDLADRHPSREKDFVWRNLKTLPAFELPASL